MFPSILLLSLIDDFTGILLTYSIGVNNITNYCTIVVNSIELYILVLHTIGSVTTSCYNILYDCTEESDLSFP